MHKLFQEDVIPANSGEREAFAFLLQIVCFVPFEYFEMFSPNTFLLNILDAQSV